MAAPSVAPVPTERRNLDPAEFRAHGIVGGLVGAAVLAAWFLVLDVMRGHVLYTPTLLARMLLSAGAGRSPDVPVEGSIGLTLGFTAVHALAFAAIGLTIAEFLRRVDLVHSKALPVVLLMVALGVTFFAFGVLYAAVGPGGLGPRETFIGNVLAAFAMAAYLGRTLGASRRD